MGNYEYKGFWRHVMPDDQLVRARVSECGLTVVEWRARSIHPALFCTLGTLSAQLTQAKIFNVDLDHTDRPWLSAWFYLAHPELIPGEAPMAHAVGVTDGRPWFEIWVRDDMIDPAMVRELNSHIMSEIFQTFVPNDAASSSGALILP